MICGIDEAGRGAVIGPLVMAGFYLSHEKVDDVLRAVGVRDSKLLSPKRREYLSHKLRSIGNVTYEILMPFKLNELMEKQTLNQIEVEAAEKIIVKIYKKCPFNDRLHTIYLDAFGPAKKLALKIEESIPFKAKVVAEHKADHKYLIVSAASILAKVTRDRIIEKLKSEIGDFGSGYPSDPKTISFLKKWVKEHTTPPPYTRTKWKTYKNMLREKSNKKLEDFE